MLLLRRTGDDGSPGVTRVRDALLLVHLASSSNGSEPFPEPVLEAIGLVRSDAVSYEERATVLSTG